MATVTTHLKVVCVHGEGDRETVNMLARNAGIAGMLAANPRTSVAQASDAIGAPDAPPDVIVVLRDDGHQERIEHPVASWEEIEEWKQIAGWDPVKRYWGSGGKVKVTFESE
jgi:hypothetical protein